MTYRSTFCLATFPAISLCDLVVFVQPRPPPCPPCPPTAAARTTVSSSEAPATQVNRICREFLFCCHICRSVFCCRNSGSCRICRIIVSLKGCYFCHSAPSSHWHLKWCHICRRGLLCRWTFVTFVFCRRLIGSLIGCHICVMALLLHFVMLSHFVAVFLCRIIGSESSL